MLKEETRRPASWGCGVVSFLLTSDVDFSSDTANGSSLICWGGRRDIITVRGFGVERIRCRI